jgi:hypothetical protein
MLDYLRAGTKYAAVVREWTGRWADRVRRGLLSWRLAQALGLGSRAGERRRREPIRRVATHLEVEWYAHDIHPWDADLPDEHRARLFAEGVLAHTVTAIRGAFDRFAEVESIAITVLEPRTPHRVLLRGAVTRGDVVEASRTVSAAMSLKLLGVEYRMSEGQLQPLS